uniref:Uncharacterized protein n=1 Tax=Anguilla anguilla TaxID=7936 RepID=A0A0E9PER0_ANGAN
MHTNIKGNTWKNYFVLEEAIFLCVPCAHSLCTIYVCVSHGPCSIFWLYSKTFFVHREQ